MNYFWFKKNLQTSITMPRVHDQLYPNFVFAETRFPTEVVNGLISLGHKVCRCVYIEKSVSDEYRISGLAFALRPRKLAPLSQPIRFKAKTNYGLVTRVLPPLREFACCHTEFLLDSFAAVFWSR